MVKSEQVFSPQEYLELVTGKTYIMRGDDDIRCVEEILKENNLELWNYPLSEINHIVENNLNVVVVECMVWNEDKVEFEHILRWFEVEGD